MIFFLPFILILFVDTVTSCTKISGSKRSVSEIKSQLKNLGCSVTGNKKQLTEKLRHAEAVKALLQSPPSHQWSAGEFDEITLFLPAEHENDWDVAELKFAYEALNSRFLSRSVASQSNLARHESIRKAYVAMYSPSARAKTRMVTADSFDDLTTRLFKKNVNRWGDREGELLAEALGDVATVTGSNSSPAALARYYKLTELLTVFYQRRPDIKAKI